jgi:chromatin remodeling complex protein RSC6
MELQHEHYRAEEWAPPPQNIQSLFESVEYPIVAQQQQTILEEDRIVTNELEKLPSTLVKLIKNLDSIRADLEAQKKEIIRTNNDMKHAQNLLLRYAKKCIKQQEKEKEVTGEKTAARGFAMPTKVSNELCEFLGVEPGTLVSRTETIVFINKYIKDRELQDPNNMQNIVLDDKLSRLFGGEASLISTISFFKMQKYLSQHFKKSATANEI